MAHCHAAVESRHPGRGRRLGIWRPLAMRQNGTRACLPGSSRIRPRSGPAAFRLVVPFHGRRMSLTYEVIGFVPDREVLLAAANGVLRSTDRIVVTGAADGSTVSYDAQVRLRAPLQVLDPLLRPGFRAVAERAAAGLAQALS